MYKYDWGMAKSFHIAELVHEDILNEFAEEKHEVLDLAEKYAKYFLTFDVWTDFVVNIDDMFIDFGYKNADTLRKHLEKKYKCGTHYTFVKNDKNNVIYYVSPIVLIFLSISIDTQISNELLDIFSRIYHAVQKQHMHSLEKWRCAYDLLDEEMMNKDEILCHLTEKYDKLDISYQKLEQKYKELSFVNSELQQHAINLSSVQKTPYKKIGMIEYIYILQTNMTNEAVHSDQNNTTIITDHTTDNRDIHPVSAHSIESNNNKFFKVINCQNLKHEKNAKVVYAKACYNMHLLETTVHHKLNLLHDNYNKNQWNDIPFSDICNTIDSIQLLLDGEKGFYSGELDLLLLNLSPNSTYSNSYIKDMPPISNKKGETSMFTKPFLNLWNKIIKRV